MKKHPVGAILYLFILVLGACENNIEVIKNLDTSMVIPVMSAKNSEILYSDSARVKMKIAAPELKRFVEPERQFTEFPKGINVLHFDTGMAVIASIRANRAMYFDNEKRWEAFGNVIAENLVKNEKLTSEELYWDQGKGIIYSTKFTTIINNDGVFYGEGGFEAKDDMSQWKMIGIKGKVTIKDSPDAP